MTYRHHHHHHHPPRRTAQDISTPVKLYVNNGTLSNFAFPCWYQEIYPPVPATLHDRPYHDHCGWPNPRHPDHICQLWIPEDGHKLCKPMECDPHVRHYIDYARVLPIHLLSEYENYNDTPTIQFANNDSFEKLSVTGWIDPTEDWVIRVAVDAHDKEAIYKPQVHRFALYLDSDGPAYPRRDLVVLGEFIVLPSAILHSDSDEPQPPQPEGE